MKTKIFLMAIIACLVGYIALDSFHKSGHSDVASRLNAGASVEEASHSSNSQHSTHNSKVVSIKKGEAPHEHTLDSHVDDHVHDTTDEKHHVIPKHIKKSLCIEDNDPLSCTVNVESDLNGILFDKTGNMLADEITTVLDSNNFQDVVEFLSTQKETNEAFVREDGYQLELRKLTNDFNVESSPLYCSETICAMTVEYGDLESSKSFFRQFFNKSNKGNIFLSQQASNSQFTTIERVMFFPENRNGVVMPQLN